MNVAPDESVPAGFTDAPNRAGAADPLPFPAGFLWGTATAATQVEGHLENEWTSFTAPDGKNCRIACDHYHRYREDIQWMHQLGIKAYRFSVEWSRLQKTPFGPLDPTALDHYRDKLKCLRAADITPMVVLHHFSNPLWLYRDGGWTKPQSVAMFLDFVGKLVPALNDYVRIWNTFNEPDTYASCSYLLGEFPPFQKLRLDLFYRVLRHMGQAHQQACELIRRTKSPTGPIEVGFTKNWTYFQTLRPNRPWDWIMARTSHGLFNEAVLDAFTRSGRNAAATFLGLNYYGRVRFHRCHSLSPARGADRARLARLGVHCDDMFERYPPGLEQILPELHERTRLPIYITEHGSSGADEAFRIADLRANLTATHRAIQTGADVRGFFYWTLLDNFEWQFGYAKRFGLLAVDFADPTLPRSLKPIAAVYRTACAENRVP